jgi:[protein-PII] uridylyltransferase
VGDARRLTALYLLTVADIRGTSPKVWNAWKGKLLEDLYRMTLRALGAPPNRRRDRGPQAGRGSAWPCTRLPGTEEPLWDAGRSYFARHDAAEIAWHARSLWRHVDTQEPVVRAPSPIGEGLQVLVYAPTSPTCSPASAATSTAPASASRTPRCTPRATATRWTPSRCTPRGRPAPPRPRAAGGAEAHRAAGRRPAARAAPRPAVAPGQELPYTPRISLRPDERATAWLLTISTSDRAGLLYAIARVLARHGINLQLAKVSTLGERVEDTFLIDGPCCSRTAASWRSRASCWTRCSLPA